MVSVKNQTNTLYGDDIALSLYNLPGFQYYLLVLVSSHLASSPCHFVYEDLVYEDLTISEFCAGYMTILENESEEKRVYRIAHLKELMYLSSRFKWRNILDYHGACLLEIERGQLRWGDSFQMLQSTTLAGGLLVTTPRAGNTGGNPNRSGSNNGLSEGVVFCKAYQRGVCPQTRDHYGQ